MRYPLQIPLAIALAFQWPIAAFALEIEPTVRVGETYTSNINLDANEEEEWVTSIEPGVELRYTGTALEMVLGYNLQALLYAEDSDRNEVFHQLDSNFLLDVVGDALQVRARGNIAQVNVTPQEPIASSNINVTGNRTDATSWDVGPQWRVPVGGGLEFEGFARYGQVLYDDTPREDDDTTATELLIQDVDRIDGRAALQSVANRASAMSYALVYEFDQLDYGSAAPEAEQQAAYLRIGYLVSDSFSIFALGGLDSDFEDFSDSSLEESRWEAGFAATTDRLRLEAAIGHRYFGTTERVSLTWTGDDSTYRLSYSMLPNTSDRVQLQRIPVAIPDPDVPEGVPPDTGIETPGLQTRFVQTRADASARWEFSRSALDVSLFWDEREDQQEVSLEDFSVTDRADESSYGVEAEFSVEPGSRSELRFGTSWRQREYVTRTDQPGFQAEMVDEDQILTITTTYRYELGTRTALSARAGFQRRAGAVELVQEDLDPDAETEDADYDEYWVGIALERTF